MNPMGVQRVRVYVASAVERIETQRVGLQCIYYRLRRTFDDKPFQRKKTSMCPIKATHVDRFSSGMKQTPEIVGDMTDLPYELWLCIASHAIIDVRSSCFRVFFFSFFGTLRVPSYHRETSWCEKSPKVEIPGREKQTLG